LMEELTRVRFTNLDKILYPELGISKSRVIEHYIKVAPRMLGFLDGRVVVMTRYPDGIGAEGFYEKDAPNGTPRWVETFSRRSDAADREIDHIVCNDLDTLLWMANLAALEMHITLSRVEDYERPDMLLFDIDPEPPAGIGEAVEVALLLKEKLDALGFRAYAKTTGKKGLHVVLPIFPEYTFRQTRGFVHQFGRHLARESDIVVSERAQSQDPGKVYIDYLQNSSGRTMICPYSLRAEPEATVSTPIGWRELRGLDPEELNVFTVTGRKEDPWEGFWEERQRLEVV
jgi:bifunctional non-homologous end joining protein LigD